MEWCTDKKVRKPVQHRLRIKLVHTYTRSIMQTEKAVSVHATCLDCGYIGDDSDVNQYIMDLEEELGR